jgi:hypothetical protein
MAKELDYINGPKDFKELARFITMGEGKIKQVNIAQISEVLKVMRQLFKSYPLALLKVMIK